MKFFISKLLFLLAIILGLFLGGCGGSAEGTDETKGPDNPATPSTPNVIVIFTDDQGFADLGAQAQLSDVKTPNIDKLANNGVRFTQGYVTAPQCSPSRAAMLTGQYQQRFGVDSNDFTPMPLHVTTLGQRFKSVGYKTGIVGKWNLEVDGNSREWATANVPSNIPYDVTKVPADITRPYFPDNRGYDDVFFGNNKRYWSTFDMQGQTKQAAYVIDDSYRVDVVSKAAVAFIERNKTHSFYLHVSHFAPHVPMEAPQQYLARFSQDMPTRRRYALASIAAIDDGVGQIIDALAKNQLLDNTIIFFISDNGAPLGEDMTDAAITDVAEAWNGSKNTPLIGEKGMLTEAGVRVPFIMSWQNHAPAGKIIDKPVSALDASYTALSLAKYSLLSELDGIDLMPVLKGNEELFDSRTLFWRFDKQKAVRQGKWKYLKAGLNREYLFDMYSIEGEHFNLIDQFPEVADSLKQSYQLWSSGMLRADENIELSLGMQKRYDFFFSGNH